MNIPPSLRTTCITTTKGVVAIILLLSARQPVQAADRTWTNGDGDNLWQNSDNWNLSPFPGGTSGFSNSSVATFSEDGSGIIDLGGTINITRLFFGVDGGDAGAFAIGDSGDTLNLSHTSVTSIGVGSGVTANETIGASINLSTTSNAQAAFVNNGSGLLTITGPVTSNQASGTTILGVGGAGNGVISGVLGSATGTSAGLQLNKSGSGTWTLSGANVYTGDTTVFGGTLVLDYGINDPVSTGNLVLNGGTMTFKGGPSGVTSDTVTKLAFGSTTTANSTANKLILDSGAGSGVNLTISTLSTIGTNFLSNLIDLSSNSNNSITVTNLDTTTFGLSTADNILVNNPSSPRPFTVVKDTGGYGFATLTSTTDGVLGRLSTGTALTESNSDSATNFRLAVGGTLTRTASLNYTTLTIDSSAGGITLDMGSSNFSGNSAGRGGILISGSNDVAITGDGNFNGGAYIFNYSTGDVSISQNATTNGTFMFGGTGFTNFSGSIGVSTGTAGVDVEGGIVRLSKSQDLTQSGGMGINYVVTGGGVLEIGADLNGGAGGDFTNAIGTGVGAIRFIGDSGISASGANRVVNFGGAGAQLAWGSGGFLSDVNSRTNADQSYMLLLSSAKSDATVEIQNPINLGSVNGNTIDRFVSVADGSAGTDAVLSGVLSGAGATLIKTGVGTLDLTAANTYTGGTIVNAGRLIVSGSLNDTANVSVSSGAELNVNGLINTASATTLAGTLSGSGTTGAVFAQNGSVLSPGNGVGTLTVNSLTLSGVAVYKLDLSDGVDAGTDFDQLAVGNSLDLTGDGAGFKLTLQGSFDPGSDHAWSSIIQTDGVSGFDAGKFTFDSSGLTGGTYSGIFNVRLTGNNIDLLYTAVPEPGTSALLIGGFGLLAFLPRIRRRGAI